MYWVIHTHTYTHEHRDLWCPQVRVTANEMLMILSLQYNSQQRELLQVGTQKITTSKDCTCMDESPACAAGCLPLRTAARYRVPRQPQSSRPAAFVCNLLNHHLLYLCSQSKLNKTNTSESAVKFLSLTAGCGGRAHRWSFLFK